MIDKHLKHVATAITSLEFLRELDELLERHGARLCMERTFGEHKLQVRFQEDRTRALTLANARPGKGVICYAGDGFKSLGGDAG